MPSTPPARSLADWLRNRSDSELAALVRTRPDLVVPLPADLGVLASRVAERTHVVRALDPLDRFTLQVLEALLLLDPPVSADDLARALDADPAPALHTLHERALVWDGPDLRTASGVGAVLEHPAGLGRPAARLLRRTERPVVTAVLGALGLPLGGDADEAATRIARALPAAFAAATQDEREVLQAVDEAGGLGGLSGAMVPADAADPSPVRRCVARGLLIPVSVDTVELPREVGLLLRGEQWLPKGEPEPPVLTGSTPRADPDATGALGAADTVRLAAVLLDAWSRTPPAELKSGGLGQRELRTTARLLDLEEAPAVLLIEVCAAAGLLARTSSLDGHFAPTAAFDSWCDLDVAGRWSLLAQAWLAMGVAPGVVGERDDREKVIAPLSANAYRPNARELRRRALEALAAAPPGTAPTQEALLGRLDWLTPRRRGKVRDTLVEQTLREAAILGVTGAGALTGYARLLLTAPERAAAALTAALPEPVDHVLLQADLTAVAPGPLAPNTARDMALLADIESPGSATVYRFSEASLRRGLDAGWTAAETRAFLTDIGRPAIPQGLSYLIDDVARRHGLLRTGSAGSYLRCDDDALLTEVLADKRLAGLRLRRIAPTVLVCSSGAAAVLEALRAAGHAPVAERPDGTVLVGGRESARAPARSLLPAFSDNHVPDEAAAARIVASLRAGDRAAALRPGPNSQSAPVDHGLSATLGLLEQAIGQARPVLLGYVNAQGQDSQRIIEPERVSGGLLTAFDQKTQERRSFAVHRITEATLLGERGA